MRGMIPLAVALAMGIVADEARAEPAAAERGTAGSIVAIEVAEEVTTKTAKRGDTFALRLARPVVVGDVLVIPAGTPGRGEVIEAVSGAAKVLKPAKPSKLILAARYLEFNGGRIPLRGFHLSAAEINSTDTVAVGASVAYYRSAPSLEAVVAAGAAGEAKLAVDIDLQGRIVTGKPVP